MKVRSRLSLVFAATAIVSLLSAPLPARAEVNTGFDCGLVVERDRHLRFAGADRYQTAAQIAKTFDSADYAVVVSGENWTDGLVAAPLARKYRGPVLLNPASGYLAASTKGALSELGVRHVFIVGGPVALNGRIITDLYDALPGLTGVTRIWGDDAYQTAAEVAARVGYSKGKAIVVSGETWPDALSVGSAAGYRGYPILLTQSDALPTATRSALAAFPSGSRAILVGGTASVSSDVYRAIDDTISGMRVETRISGSDRYAVAANVARYFNQIAPGDAARVSLVNGESAWPDALAVGPFAASGDDPILLTTDTYLPAATRSLIVDKQGQGNTTVAESGETLEVSTRGNIKQFAFAGGSASISHGQEFVVDALQWVGVKYVYGGEGPVKDSDGVDKGFDCAGLIWYTVNYRSNAQRKLDGYPERYPQLASYPRHTAATQYGWVESDGSAATTHISTPTRTGDQVFFGSPISHTGFYVGGDLRLDAPHTYDRVKVQDLGSPTGANRYWSEDWPWVN